jgi:hypothetical protein
VVVDVANALSTNQSYTLTTRLLRARSHCRFVRPRIHFIPDSRTYSVPLVLKRQFDRTPRLLAADGTLVVAASLTGVLEPGGWARVQAPLTFPVRRFGGLFLSRISSVDVMQTAKGPYLEIISSSNTYATLLNERCGHRRAGRWCGSRHARAR